MEAIQCNGNNAVRLIQYYDQASPKFVRSLFNLGLVGNANVAPVVEDAVDSQYRGSLVAIVVDARHLLNFYVGLAHSKITSLVLMDGSMNLFYGQFTSTMTKRYLKDRVRLRLPKTPYPGSLLVIRSFDILREADCEGEKRVTVLINDCSLAPSPPVKRVLLISKGLPPDIEESKKVWIRRWTIDQVRRRHCLMFLCPFESDDQEVKMFYSCPDRNPLDQQHPEESSLWMPFPHRRGYTLTRFNDAIKSNLECDCVKIHGYEQCLLIQYPLELIHPNSVLETMHRQIPGDPQCLQFRQLTNDHKRWVVGWWYSVNFFGSVTHLPQSEAVPSCVSEHLVALWPQEKGEGPTAIEMSSQPKIDRYYPKQPRRR